MQDSANDKIEKIREIVMYFTDKSYSVSLIARKCEIEPNKLSDILRIPARGIINAPKILDALELLKKSNEADVTISDYKTISSKLDRIISLLTI